MTQPTPPDGNGQIIAAAALGLALIALEEQVRTRVQTLVYGAAVVIAAAAVAAAATAPLTGIALLSIATFHTRLTTTLDAARARIRDVITSAYQAAAETTRTKLQADLGDLPPLPELGTALDTILRDVDTAIGNTQADLQNNIRAAYDGITGPEPIAARIIAVRMAVINTTAKLADRTGKAAATAVHRASTDTQQAMYDHYQTTTGTPGLMKRWRTTSNNPCGMCHALNGTVVGINAEFDHAATTDDKDLRPIWRNLSGPPRHPNCRCQIELVVT